MNSSDRQRALNETNARNAEANMLAKKHQHLKTAVQAATDKLRTGEEFPPLVDEILTRVVHKVLGQYQDKVNVGMQDSVADLLSTFKQKILLHIFDASNNWKVRNRGTVLFPSGCRYLYTRGISTIAMIEQQPQLRTLKFREGMQESSANEDWRRGSNEERVQLAMPYVYFLIHFKEHTADRLELAGVYSGWSTSQVTQLGDMLASPILPNTHKENGNICMGYTPIPGDTINSVCNNVVSHYWQSKFTNELADSWWNKSTIDNRIRTGRIWAANSQENPLFILNVRLPRDYSVSTVMDLLTRFETEPDELSARDSINKIVDDCVETLYTKILRYFKKTKFDKFYPKEATDQVHQSLTSVIDEMNGVLLALEHELNKLSDEVSDLSPGMRWKKRGDFWAD